MNSHLRSAWPPANGTPASELGFFGVFQSRADRSAAPFSPAAPLQAGGPAALATAMAPKTP